MFNVVPTCLEKQRKQPYSLAFDALRGRRKMKRGFALLGVCAFGLCGCGAGIKVSSYSDEPASRLGVPYNLPMTSFKITVVRTINKCGAEIGGNVQATVETTKKVDPTARYTLYSDGFWSTTDIKGQYAADGTTTGLNTSSEGQAGQAISDIITTVATIAPLIAAAAAPVAGAPAVELCKPDVAAAVLAVSGGPDQKKNPGLKATVDSESAKLTELTNNLTVLTAQITAMGASVDSATQAEFWPAVQAVFDLKTKLAADQAELTKQLKLIQNTEIIYWPLKSNDSAKAFQFDRTALGKWVDLGNVHGDPTQFDVFMKIDRKDDGTFSAAEIAAPPMPAVVDPKKGVPVRFPTTGTLRICSNAACGAGTDKSVSETDASILQFGHVYMVPVAGNAFRSTTMALAYDANGNPTSVEVANKTAIITTATSTAKLAATSIAGIPAAISSAKLAQTKAESDQIAADVALASARAGSEQAIATATAKTQTDLLTAKAALAKAQADGQNGPDLLALQSQTTLLNAQQAQLTAQQALDAASKVHVP